MIPNVVRATLQPLAVSTTTPARRRWSWRIGSIVGCDVYVHATFPLLFVWIAMNAFSRGASVRTVVATLVLTLAVFVVVVLHECGHALTARRFGVQTRGSP